jgi:hypothetical protein
MDRQLPLDPYTLTEVAEPWRNRAAGVKGHAVKHEAFTQAMEEIVHVIEEAGLDPSPEDLTQLWQALQKITTQEVGSRIRLAYGSPGAQSWTVPADITRVFVTLWGGGAGGGGADGLQSAGAGGGPGGYASGWQDVTPGQVVNFAVGAGGAGGSAGSGNGSGGGTTSFLGLSATGGSGGGAGVGGIQGTSATSGSGSGGSLNLSLSNSGIGFHTVNGVGDVITVGGFGGASYGGSFSGPNVSTGGLNGSFSGGGGSGASANAAGGTGGAGLVLIEY